jgi:mono/diheme cytochrome c family protein
MNHFHLSLLVIFAIHSAVLTAPDRVAGQEQTTDDSAQENVAQTITTPNNSAAVHFFETNIRPLLLEHCIKCHGDQKQEGGLRLDSREAFLTGGDTGPALVVGDAAKSLLVDAIHYRELEMPPEKPLADSQIADIERWISAGAAWPAEQTLLLRSQKTFTDQERQHWSFRPLFSVEVPNVQADWCRNEIDRFVWQRLNTQQLKPGMPAERSALIRRVTFQLTGLPPTAEEVHAFVHHPAEDAYEQLLTRLLESPAFGERWAQHWLDLVRYADSDGYKADDFRPLAWRYRDYVIASLNANKPFDQFIREQIAGDEIDPHNPQAIAATGYLRCGIYEYNQADVATQWSGMIDDITEVTADALLGLTFQCAKCHDHKFDPILQKDFYRLRAFFEPLRMHEDRLLATQQEIAAYQAQLAIWSEQTAEIRQQLAAIEDPLFTSAERTAYDRFPDEIRAVLDIASEDRSPHQRQLAELAERQIQQKRDAAEVEKKLKDEKLAAWKKLKSELKAFDHLYPAELPRAQVAIDIGSTPPPTMIPGIEDQVIEPGYLSILDPRDLQIEPIGNSSGRRTALANWLVSRQNPLTARVIVNRIWQMHFGNGLVNTPNNFGKLGTEPSHPELLDFLAMRFIESDWDIKAMHHFILQSATYQQSTAVEPELLLADPGNRWLARQNRQRLDGEEIRDAILLVSGKLDQRVGGPAVDFNSTRRSIYLKAWRNQHEPLMEAFDLPERSESVGKRNVTVTAPQSLLMMNGPWLDKMAVAFADRLESEFSEPRVQVEQAFVQAYGREPSQTECDDALQAMQEINRVSSRKTEAGKSTAGLIGICHVLFNGNEFLFTD